MSDIFLKEFEWTKSLLDLYARFYPCEHSFFLYSSLPNTENSRFSYLGCNPQAVFFSKRDRVTITSGDKTETFTGNPWDRFAQLMHADRLNYCFDKTIFGQKPFFGGAVGYWGYDLKDQLESLGSRAEDDLGLPDSYWMLYTGIAFVDHVSNKKYLVGDADTIKKLENIIRSDVPSPSQAYFDFELATTVAKNGYLNSIKKIKELVAAGDAYEVNLSQRFDIHLRNKNSGTDIDIFRNLVETSPSPFSAILRCKDFSVISSSPERFLKISDGSCESKPIKGTRPRKNDFHEDEKQFLDLLHSDKDRAENLMIVDLVRNDLGRISEIGSVHVENIFTIEKYSTVFQMVSTVKSTLDRKHTFMDAITSCFPPGSMTGAPKIRAMEIIEELEKFKRGIYSGALGYIGYDGNLDLSVIIRTLITQGDRAYFQTGGAIVWDSDPEEEYQECWDKARGILKALENIISPISRTRQ